MVPTSRLVTLVRLIDAIPSPPPTVRGRGRPKVYPDRLFLKALVIMIVRHLPTVHALLRVLEQDTPEMHEVRAQLTLDGCFPTQRTFQRRLAAIPDTLPAQIACLGSHLVTLLDPWVDHARAAAIDSTVLRAFGGFVWHRSDQDAGRVPHTGIDTEAGWTKSGYQRLPRLAFR